MKFLSLDVSSNTGFAVFDNDQLINYGLSTRKIKDYKADIKSYKDFKSSYPYNILEAAERISEDCLDMLLSEKIKYVVIEHPEAGKQRISQRFLEWTHLTIFNALVEHATVKYLLVSDWRKHVKCYLKHWPEFQKWNKEVKAAKAKATPTKTGRKLAKIDGKVVSKMDQKKLSIHIANEQYGINIKDDNIADAINIGTAAYALNIFNEE